MSPPEEVYASADNAVIMLFNNELLDCVYIDLDDRYAVISPHSYPDYDEVADRLEEAGCHVLSVGNFCMDEPPYSYIINSLGKMIVGEAESLIS